MPGKVSGANAAVTVSNCDMALLKPAFSWMGQAVNK